MRKYMNITFIIFLCSTLFLAFFGGEKMNLPVIEDFGISVGVGVGIDKNSKGNINYRVSTTGNVYKEAESIESILSAGVGSTIGKTREDRQRKKGKDFFLGLTKVYIIEDEYAGYGIKGLVDIIFKNPIFNNNAFIVVCKGRIEEYFSYMTPGYNNSAEYISDMIKSSVNYNFFKGDYMFINVVLSMDAEGKNTVVPYISIMEDGIKITGMAIFKKDKLATILDMNDTKIMNMLRESKVKGILTIQKDSEKYVNYEAKAKRKITCEKIGDKYTFTIDLNLEGDIINNELYKNMAGKISITKKFEDDMASQVKNMCITFLDKMKNEYKIDLLQLGWVAAAKYGRDTGVDWNEVICKSNIKVNVKVHVDKVGRGQY